MANSIFDDDDDGIFSLSGGFDEGDKTMRPAPKQVPSIKAPIRTTPEQKITPRQPPALPQTNRAVAPQAPNAQRGLTRPPTSMPATHVPSHLPSQPTTVDETPTALPMSKLPAMPVVEKSFTQLPTSQQIPQQTYEATPFVPDTSVEDRAYDRRREEEAEEEARYQRKEARRREEERAERIKRDAENRILERKRLEEEENLKYQTQKEQPEPAPSPVKGKKGKSKQGSPKEKTSGSFSGSRKNILILRIVVFTVIGIFLIAGVKTAFFPTPGPTPNQVVSTVKKGLGITAFPKEQGSGFIMGFSKVYLTIQANGGGERVKDLAPYMTTKVISEQRFSQDNNSQTSNPQNVTSGPYISGVKSKDDNNAVYTVAAQVNNGPWLYIDIPVYYDDKNDAFTVSGTPAFVPAPAQGKLVGEPKPWLIDDKDVGVLFTENAKQFFPAWGSSNKEVMAPYITPDATSTVKNGLSGNLIFKSLNSVSVSEPEEGKDPKKRKARVSIQWESALVPGTTYAQTYDLNIQQVGDLWRIHSIEGGVTTETAK